MQKSPAHLGFSPLEKLCSQAFNPAKVGVATVRVHLGALCSLALGGVFLTASAIAQTGSGSAATVLVTPDNFVRAETDLYFSGVVKNNGFGKFDHTLEPAPLDKQSVIRLNRDTLYSAAVFDLDAGPVTITLPAAGKRFVSLQVINQDHYTQGVHYKSGSYTLERKAIGTRYVVVAVRSFVDPADPADVRAAHAVQDGIKVAQIAPGIRPGGPCFDPKGETLPVSEFEPMLRRVFAAPKQSVYQAALKADTPPA